MGNLRFDAHPPHLLPFYEDKSMVAEEVCMAQRIIDLDDLPAPIARGLEVVAEMARVLAGKRHSAHRAGSPPRSRRAKVLYMAV